MTERIKLCRGIDAWSAVHLLGCYFLMTLHIVWWLVLIFGIIWEICDYLYACFRLELPEWLAMIFDPRGADIMDIMFDSFGITLYLILFHFNLVG